MKKILLIIFIVKCNFCNSTVLWDKTRPLFYITTSSAKLKELEAANFLKKIFDIQSGHDWKILPYINKNKCIKITQLNSSKKNPGKSHYKIEIANETISLSADSSTLITCVAKFLGKFTNCKVYSDEVAYYPFLSTVNIQSKYSENCEPFFSTRLLYERSAANQNFIDWHGLSNNSGPISNEHSFGWGLWVHSFFTLLPPAKHYESNPEFYSLVSGKRLPEQLCLSNKNVLQLVIFNLRKLIDKNPNYKYWSVSQMDNQNFCQCQNCSEITNQEGSNAGPIIRFVNEIAKYFPSKSITTLAYQYSRTAPKLTKPLSNVVVTVCDLEGDKNLPLTTPNKQDLFQKDLKSWLLLTKNVMVWDYTINFQNIAAPFPNMDAFQPAILNFKKMGVRMLFEQGWHSYGGGLQEYKAYLLAKLLYNPALNVKNIKKEFFLGYYGAAGTYLIKIIDKMQLEARQSGVPLSIFGDLLEHSKGYLSKKNRLCYMAMLDTALKVTSSEKDVFERVDKFAQAFRVSEIELNSSLIGTQSWGKEFNNNERLNIKNNSDSVLNEFIEKAKLWGPKTIKENSFTLDEYKSFHLKKFMQNVENNLATEGSIRFKNPYIPAFEGLGENTLIDGILGTDDWSTTWQGWGNTDIEAIIDTKKDGYISQFRMRFIKDSLNNLVWPQSVKLFSSINNIDFKEIANITLPLNHVSEKSHIITFEQQLKKPIYTKYVKVIAKWPGYTLKENRTIGSFMFSDEIYLQ
jgi:Domain of unknown function (DUF4838)